MQDILGKHVRGVSITGDLIGGFHKLFKKIDKLLTRAGRKQLIPAEN